VALSVEPVTGIQELAASIEFAGAVEAFATPMAVVVQHAVEISLALFDSVNPLAVVQDLAFGC
jgi:hypothetical protein